MDLEGIKLSEISHKEKYKMKKPTTWENIYSGTSDKGLISKLYKELIKISTPKNPNN